MFTDYGAGLGVFAAKKIPKGEVVTEYAGCIVPKNPDFPDDGIFTTPHFKSIAGGGIHVIHGLQRPICWCGVGSLLNSSSTPNCGWYRERERNKDRIYIISLAEIKEDTELLLDYDLM